MKAKRDRGTVPKWNDSEILEFWELVERCGPDRCWLWQGHTNVGYGVIFQNGNQYYAHRIAYWYGVGPFAAVLDIDHVWDRGCRSKLCCNPAHLEPVTKAENHRRWHRSLKTLPGYDPTKCRHGHDREPGQRCLRCAVAAVARSQAKKPEKYREMKREQKRRERERAKCGRDSAEAKGIN